MLRGNESQMILFRNNGFKVYPGITAKEAKELKAAWESSDDNSQDQFQLPAITLAAAWC